MLKKGTFNTYGKGTESYDVGKVIWNRVDKTYPCGGTISVTGVTAGTIFKAGSLCKLDKQGGTLTIVKAEDIKVVTDAITDTTNVVTRTDNGKTVYATDIVGMLFNDVSVPTGVTYATGAVLIAGAVSED